MNLKPLVLSFALSFGALFAAPILAEPAVTLTISCGSVGMDAEVCKQNVAQWSAKTGHHVSLYAVPPRTTDILAIYQQQFAAQSPDIDVMMIDIAWIGLLKEDLLDLTKAGQDVVSAHFPSIIANNTVDGQLLAMPWFTEAGLLYYRTDLLSKYNEKVPNTWNALAASAQRIQTAERKAGHHRMYGFVFQAKMSESLTCNALEWIASHNGGSILDTQGRITINNPQAALALDTAASWIGTISPRAVLNGGEEDARAMFMAGDAVFMRNWPYAWNVAQSQGGFSGKIGVAPLPQGAQGLSKATLGGWQLAVSKYSKHPAQARDLVMFLSGKELQKKRAMLGYNPTIVSLYQDADLLKKNPFFADLLPIFQSSIARPATVTAEKYNAVSNAFWNTSHAVLAKKLTGAQAVARLEEELKQIRGQSGW